MKTRFEYDQKKEKTNLEKHGIDFKNGISIFSDPNAIELHAKWIDGEKRFAVIGQYNEKVWTLIYTPRQEKKRIISIRRARKEEITLYEKNNV
jgi:uncharacterized protein